MPSVELVPQSDDRFAWNVLHSGAPDSAELPYHNSQLTAEQAARVEQNYSVEFYLGTHGIAGTSRFDRFSAPTQKEYEAAARIAESLRPGDVLFIEAYGFRNPVNGQETTEAGRFVTETEVNSSTFIVHSLGQHALREKRDQLERDRSNLAISAWGYAAGLAQIKGVEVISADADAYDAERLAGLPVTGPGSDRLHVRRERAALNILKDWALEHLPSNDVHDPGEKRRLVMLFGSGHEESIGRQIAESNLKASISRLEASTLQERTLENFTPEGLVVGAIAALGPKITAQGLAIPKIKGSPSRRSASVSFATLGTRGGGFARRRTQLNRTRFNARTNSIDKGIDKAVDPEE